MHSVEASPTCSSFAIKLSSVAMAHCTPLCSSARLAALTSSRTRGHPWGVTSVCMSRCVAYVHQCFKFTMRRREGDARTSARIPSLGRIHLDACAALLLLHTFIQFVPFKILVFVMIIKCTVPNREHRRVGRHVNSGETAVANVNLLD